MYTTFNYISLYNTRCSARRSGDIVKSLKYIYFCLFEAFFILGYPSESQSTITKSFSHPCYIFCSMHFFNVGYLSILKFGQPEVPLQNPCPIHVTSSIKINVSFSLQFFIAYIFLCSNFRVWGIFMLGYPISKPWSTIPKLLPSPCYFQLEDGSILF